MAHERRRETCLGQLDGRYLQLELCSVNIFWLRTGSVFLNN